MPVYQCPIDSCSYVTADVPNKLAVQFMVIHATIHTAANTATNPTEPTPTPPRPEKVRRPVVSASGTGEDWNYFNARCTI